MTPRLNIAVFQLIDNSLHRYLKLVFFQFAFPNFNYIPAGSFELSIIFSVSFRIPIYFLLPKFRVTLRPDKIFAAFVPMPKTAIHKDGCFIFWQKKIRFAGIAFVILPVTEAFGEKILPHLFLGLRVFTVNPRHVKAADFFCVYVCHIPGLRLFRSILPEAGCNCYIFAESE